MMVKMGGEAAKGGRGMLLKELGKGRMIDWLRVGWDTFLWSFDGQ